MNHDFQFEKIAENISGSEGPGIDSAGNIFVIAPNTGDILQVKNGIASVVINTGAIPAGLQIDSQGRIWIADMKLGILRLENDRKFTKVVSEWNGKPIRGCNDLSLDALGRLYFTAPAGSNDKQFVGEVYWRDENGKVEQFDRGLAFPNGISVAPDRSYLVYAETYTRKLWRWTLDASGRPTKRSFFAELPGKDPIGGDGMDFDSECNLLATNYGEGSIDVFRPDGSLVERIMLPFKYVSNVDFHPNGSPLWLITEQENNALWRFQWRRGGALTRKIGIVPWA